VVLDEGHVIRNGKDTSRWIHCMGVAADATTRWILSATPVQNSYSDWRNLCAWLRVTCEASDLPEVGPQIMLRRTMAELRDTIAALPPTPRFHCEELTIPATGPTLREGKLFRSLCDQLESVMDSRAVSALMKLELYMRIQQFLVHPQIYIAGMRKKFRGAYPRPDWTGTATKWAACLRELQVGVRQEKSQIVFCNFRAEMDMVAETAAGMGATVFCIRGGMGSEAVGEAVTGARNASASGPVVVVVQIVSGGAGLNLQFCTRILFLSQHWNPAVVHQAVGRAVRIGQRSIVDIFMYRIVDSVLENLDRRMVEVHLAKIAGARNICETLYEGFAPLSEMRFESLADDTEEGPGEPVVVSEDDPTAVVVDA
jgi:SNF2 family DNA or RNA helicase